MKKIGFIGLGEMGALMAKNLLGAGYQLSVFDINKQAVEELYKQGATESYSAKEVGEYSNITIVMARTTEQVNAIILGEKGLLEGCKVKSRILIMSTISPIAVQNIAEIAKKRNIEVLDAPVSGGRQGAEDATLSIMVGGDKKVFQEVRPIFEKIGKQIFYLGDYGMGEVAKIANNLLLLINMNAAYEAIELVEKAGLSVESFLDVVKPSTGGSWVLEHWDMVNSWKNNYKPGGTLDLIYKDFGLASGLAQDLKVPVYLGALASQLGRY